VSATALSTSGATFQWDGAGTADIKWRVVGKKV
jgi:hypothetical protein